MEGSRQLPASLDELLNSGVIRRLSDDEFAIDVLRHRERTGSGWSTVRYSLRIEADDEDQPSFDIVEEIEDVGEDVLLTSPDPDDAAGWIEEQIEEMKS